ncbi:MAG TPA: quinone oxidoreductase, partial [Chloroflexota bacterium]|nr:quinone oxidoreductase [Chloroflexota bacterium]
MKAIRIHELGGPEVLRLEEVETPVPGPGQVLIKVAAVGINYADLAQREGRYMTRTRVPTILGAEVAGTVAALGPDVTTPAVGTRVAALVSGGYAEYAVAPAGAVIPIPDTMSFAEAAAFPIQGLSAYQLLHDAAKIQPGERVLIHAAAGGVGTLAVQVAKLMGAGLVIGTASTEEKLALAKQLGADVGVNYTEEDWVEQVKEATGGEGTQIVLEMVGGEIARRSLECLTPFDGRMVVFGAASGKPATFSGAELMAKNVAVIGYWLAPYLRRQDRIAEATRALMQYLASGKLRIIVGSRFPLAEAAQAHRAMAERKTTG